MVLRAVHTPFSAKGTKHTYNVGIDGWYGWIHQITLTGLMTNTRYYYIVGPSSNPSEEFSFVTAPIVADMGTVIPAGFAVTDQIYNDHESNHFAMVVHAGDVCYAGTGHEWELEEVWDVYGN